MRDALYEKVPFRLNELKHCYGERVHLVGYSRGGTVSLYAARLAPDLIRSLTFVEGGTGIALTARDKF